MTGLSTTGKCPLSHDLYYAVASAVGTVMRARYPQLPELWWSAKVPADGGWRLELSGIADDGDADGVQRWAAELDLEPAAEPGLGAVGYRGLVDGHPVVVWAVVDRAVWEAWETAKNPRAPLTATRGA